MPRVSSMALQVVVLRGRWRGKCMGKLFDLAVVLLADHAALHHEADLLHPGDVIGRVAADGDGVDAFAGLDTAVTPIA